MKTLYGLQLGNYLIAKGLGRIRVNSMTKKKIGFISPESGKETYKYLPDLSEIKLTEEILGKYKDVIEDWNKAEDGESFYILPENTTNLYHLRFFHELQNILELHNTRIEWID